MKSQFNEMSSRGTHNAPISNRDDIFFNSKFNLQLNIQKLGRMIIESKHLVAFTGAGISTSSAMPSATHMALVELEKKKNLKFVISQDELPGDKWILAEDHFKKADVVLCVGTSLRSLQITLACNLKAFDQVRGKIVIVNHQTTQGDDKAKLVIYELVDKIILGVMESLKMPIPPYVRIDLFQIIYGCNSAAESKHARWSIEVCSVHGESAPLPFIQSVEVSFPERPDLEKVLLEQQPFSLKRRRNKKPIKVALKLNFSDGCVCRFITVELPVDFQDSEDYVPKKMNVVFQKLRDEALKSGCCGQLSVVEKKLLSASDRVSTSYAIVTNIKYAGPRKEKEFDDQARSGMCLDKEQKKKKKFMPSWKISKIEPHGDTFWSKSSSKSELPKSDRVSVGDYVSSSELSQKIYDSLFISTMSSERESDNVAMYAPDINNFMYKKDNWYITDLHEHNLKDAMYRVQLCVSWFARGSCTNGEDRMKIITGRGNHSAGGVPTIKPKVEDFLKSHNIRYYEENPGSLRIWLDGKTYFPFMDTFPELHPDWKYGSKYPDNSFWK